MEGLTAAAANNDDRDQNDDPAAAVVTAKERVEAAHYNTSFLYPHTIGYVGGGRVATDFRLYRICPSPVTMYLIVVSSVNPIGPRACSF